MQNACHPHSKLEAWHGVLSSRSLHAQQVPDLPARLHIATADACLRRTPLDASLYAMAVERLASVDLTNDASYDTRLKLAAAGMQLGNSSSVVQQFLDVLQEPEADLLGLGIAKLFIDAAPGGQLQEGIALLGVGSSHAPAPNAWRQWQRPV